ncbi:Methyltransferase-like protein 10 [Phlyctochytrium planicorne]|nr:Methyltransferase-like protein 10 [Phlyctochytrium planicorne]
MVEVQVLYFASAKDAAETSSETVTATDSTIPQASESSTSTSSSPSVKPNKPRSTLRALVRHLVELHPDLTPILKTAMVSVNLEYVDRDLWMHSEDGAADGLRQEYLVGDAQPGMELADSSEFDPSVLGTKEQLSIIGSYAVYKREVKNFDDNGDIGEIWFGEESVEKMIDWILENITDKATRTIDLGCGNGHMLLEMSSLGYTKLVGVDYSQHSVDLAIKVADEQRKEGIIYKQMDILKPNASFGKFQLALDKGTLDAISLSKSTEDRDKYSAAVANLLEDQGILLITSCNWTEEELIGILKNDFTLSGRVKYPTFKFGGVEGQKIVTVAFCKK